VKESTEEKEKEKKRFFSSNPRWCYMSHRLSCRHGQIQGHHHTQPVSKMTHTKKKGMKNSRSQKYESFEAISPKFQKNLLSAKKNDQKSLKKQQANHMMAESAPAEAIKALVKPKAVNPKMSKGTSHTFNLLAFIAHPKLGSRFEVA
jgi:large subunit ribosomal protein L29e